jgi:2-polyprenyl-3-methyl-5-hydroxy-6-metoxy-1,4-benzoquinol methylase
MQAEFLSSEPADGRRIRSAASPECILCGSKGAMIYRHQSDRLFGAGGSWNFRKCTNQKCGLLWLDPMPIKEDAGKAYARYYTHTPPSQARRSGQLRRMYRLMKHSYLVSRYKYQVATCSWPVRILGKILYLLPVRRNEVDSDARYLEAVPQGYLLDAGCGSGEWLTLMREMGWRVAGTDLDEIAVGVARLKGLDVGCGALEEQGFADGSFDAVTLSHVIEHVHDPVGTLLECARVLRPGGKLVLLTPNGSSLSHQLFGKHWRGLEPPRHLHVFSKQSLPSLLRLAGFRNVTIRPQIAKSVIYESVLLRRGRALSFPLTRRSWSASVYAGLFSLVEQVLLMWDSSAADCVAAIAVRE